MKLESNLLEKMSTWLKASLELVNEIIEHKQKAQEIYIKIRNSVKK